MTDSGLDLETKTFSPSGRGRGFFLTSLFIELITQRGGDWAGVIFSIREPVHEVCLNSARQLITGGHGKEQNATQRFRKYLQLLRNVQLEKSVGWTQNPPTFGSWGFNSPSRHHDYPIVFE